MLPSLDSLSRADFYGVLEIDPVTLKRAPQYPIWKTMCQFFFVSLPIMLLASLCMGFMALSQFWIEEYLLEVYSIDSYIHLVPSIVQAMLVAILTIFYDRFATYLTVMENHKTQSQYEKYRVIKLIVLEFVNNFFSLLYIAFIKRDNKMLQNQLMTQMIVLQVRMEIGASEVEFIIFLRRTVCTKYSRISAAEIETKVQLVDVLRR